MTRLFWLLSSVLAGTATAVSGAGAPARAPAPTTAQAIVTIPAGAKAGQHVRFRVSGGQVFEVVVPEGVIAGQQLKVAIPNLGPPPKASPPPHPSPPPEPAPPVRAAPTPSAPAPVPPPLPPPALDAAAWQQKIFSQVENGGLDGAAKAPPASAHRAEAAAALPLSDRGRHSGHTSAQPKSKGLVASTAAVSSHKKAKPSAPPATAAGLVPQHASSTASVASTEKPAHGLVSQTASSATGTGAGPVGTDGLPAAVGLPPSTKPNRVRQQTRVVAVPHCDSGHSAPASHFVTADRHGTGTVMAPQPTALRYVVYCTGIE
jgi:hypothetical protein